MWFKHCQIFQLNETFAYQPEELAKRLGDYAFEACSSVQAQASGWVSPQDKSELPLVHAANGLMLIALKHEEKVLPAAVLRQRTEVKVAELEEKEGRRLRKKERDGIKDEIYHTMISQAFSKTDILHGIIDTAHGWLLVNTSSAKQAERFTEHLRRALGSLKIQLPEIAPVPMLLTDWLKSQKYPADLVIEDACILQDTKEDGSIRLNRQNLLGDEVKSLINAGREVVQLTLNWRDEIRFTLSEDFIFKSLKYLEAVKSARDEIFTETVAAKFDADFTIMSEALIELVDGMLKIFTKAQGKTTSDKKAAALETV